MGLSPNHRGFNLGVSLNSGFSPQIIQIKNRGFHYFHHPFWGTTILGNPQLAVPFSIHIFVGSYQSSLLPDNWTSLIIRVSRTSIGDLDKFVEQNFLRFPPIFFQNPKLHRGTIKPYQFWRNPPAWKPTQKDIQFTPKTQKIFCWWFRNPNANQLGKFFLQPCKQWMVYFAHKKSLTTNLGSFFFQPGRKQWMVYIYHINWWVCRISEPSTVGFPRHPNTWESYGFWTPKSLAIKHPNFRR